MILFNHGFSPYLRLVTKAILLIFNHNMYLVDALILIYNLTIWFLITKENGFKNNLNKLQKINNIFVCVKNIHPQL